MEVIERNQFVERGGELVGQLVHFAVDHGGRGIDLALQRQLGHLSLQPHVLLLDLQIAIEQRLLFRQDNQRLILLLRLAQAGLDVLDARLVLLQRLRVAIDQQAQGQGANAQSVLGHLPHCDDTGQPVAVDLLGLLAHAGHLHQGEPPQGKHQQGHQTEAQARPGRDIHASQVHLPAPSKSAAQGCSCPLL
ncbi:hypothetical protein D3C76_897340 [compost metagenome]